jgi:hypothetical protein
VLGILNVARGSVPLVVVRSRLLELYLSRPFKAGVLLFGSLHDFVQGGGTAGDHQFADTRLQVPDETISHFAFGDAGDI